IEPAFRPGRIVDAKVHFPQPSLGLARVPAVEHGKVVEEGLSAQMHSHPPQINPLIRVSNRFVCSHLCGPCNRNKERKGTGERVMHQVSSRNSTAIMPNSSDATIATARAGIFLRFSDSASWHRSGFWRYPDSRGNQWISRRLRAR